MKLILLFIFLSSCTSYAQQLSPNDYTKTEYHIPMRDGLELYTAIYQPKDTSNNYPFLIERVAFGSFPYGEEFKKGIMYNEELVQSGYIFVYQDMRGRSMSDGETITNLMPVYSQSDPNKIDETTDTWDGIEWLLKNVKHHNGKVGFYGNSYSGWMALMATLSKHPAIKAVQIGGPTIDLYFEDFNRYGAFTLAYTPIMDWLGIVKKGRFAGAWWDRTLDYFADGKWFGLAKDSYDFYLQKGALKNYDDLISPDNYFWNFIKEHPNYDAARQERNTINYIKNLDCPILFVSGWNEEQNLYGSIKGYQAISKNNKQSTHYIMGPWSHRNYKTRDSSYYLGNIYFGKNLGLNYQQQEEFVFFETHLKDNGNFNSKKVQLFDTGLKKWVSFDQYPQVPNTPLFLKADENLTWNADELDSNNYLEYISDPNKPVPYIEHDNFLLFPSNEAMTADQRFASKRPDVLTFISPPLEEDLTVLGDVLAQLTFATNKTDADIFVKLIDVLPMDRAPQATDKKGVKMNGYQQLVRFGNIRGRYREGFDQPKAFTPNQITAIEVELLDLFHTFKKGHRIMIQIQSSMFPLFDRNPQNYIDNIYFADDKDFVKAMHQIYEGSKILIPIKK